MSTYVIGDIHGCFDGLNKLLETIDYNAKNDTLFFLGDLINKGPNSLDVLTWLMQQQNCHTVLGNHDLYIIHSIINKIHSKNTTATSLMNEPNAIEWLLQQPLLIEHKDCFFCHAGIHPKWSNSNISDILNHQHDFINASNLNDFYSQPSWQRAPVYDNPFFIMAALTEMRFLNRQDLSLEPGSTDNVSDDPNKIAWFDITCINHTPKHVYFGHWARLSTIVNNNSTCLDGGYVYGEKLLCQRLDDGKRFSVTNQSQKT